MNKSKQKKQSDSEVDNFSSPWKAGDWCFFEYKLAMVEAVDVDGRVTKINDGLFATFSFDLRDRMFPMDLRGKRISDEYQRQYNKLANGASCANRNFADLHRWFIGKWVKCMERRNNDDAVKAAYKELNKFVRRILRAYI